MNRCSDCGLILRFVLTSPDVGLYLASIKTLRAAAIAKREDRVPLAKQLALAFAANARKGCWDRVLVFKTITTAPVAGTLCLLVVVRSVASCVCCC